MFKYPKAKFEKIPRYIWILLAITLVGIFLRTYNFHDWLLFGPDQARDAIVVDNALNGTNPIVLGAQAGNTQFFLGPIYYQFGYISALIFGNSPDKLAYPDLLFSILTIPLLFYFLKKYFSVNIALFLSALFSVANFSIYGARFAVNSNSLSFFVILFLYGLLELMDEKNKHKHIWAIVVGVSLGIGIQLHALAFLAMPIAALVACIYLIKERNLTWKIFLLVVLFFLLMNFGQLIYETKSGGANFRHFLKGASSESSGLSNGLGENVFLTMFCQTRSNVNQISALNTPKYCDYQFNLGKSITNYKRTASWQLILVTLIGIIFALGGYWLWLLSFFDKKLEPAKKRLLALLLFFNVVFLGLFVLVVSQAEVHYFNFIFFMPFIFMGLWIERVSKSKLRANAKKAICVFLAVLLVLINLYFLYEDSRKYISGQASDSEISILGEVIPISIYVIENSHGSTIAYLDGDRFSTHRFSAPLGYLTSKSGLEIAKLNEKNKINSDAPLFFIRLIDNGFEKNVAVNTIGEKKVKDYKRFGNIIIYILDAN